MKPLLLKASVYLVAILALHIVAGFSANGSIDPYYLRFTTPRQSSLIIGSSRAAQGLLPAEISPAIRPYTGGRDIYNFAFSVNDSPYGDVYIEAIEKKLLPDSTNGVFLVSVNPWLISSVSNTPNDAGSFRETSGILNHIESFSTSPNFEYLLQNYHKGWLRLFRQHRASTFLRDDGWLEISVPMDDASVAKRMARKIQEYEQGNLPRYRLSGLRLEKLRQLALFLQNRGKVYLVRMPVRQEILTIENRLAPDFDRLMKQMADNTHVSYLDFSTCPDAYAYTDGVHVQKDSGRVLSGQVARLVTESMRSGEPLLYSCNQPSHGLLQ